MGVVKFFGISFRMQRLSKGFFGILSRGFQKKINLGRCFSTSDPKFSTSDAKVSTTDVKFSVSDPKITTTDVKFVSGEPKVTTSEIRFSTGDPNFSSSDARVSSTTSERTANFGYRVVREEDKERLVGGVFSSVANSYDIMNDVMSLGIHRCWKDEFVNDIGFLRGTPGEPTTIIDMAGGTGDIAYRIIDKHQDRGLAKDLHIKVMDINEEMLKAGRDRARANRYFDKCKLEFLVANAEKLDIPDSSIDLYTIAFGIRNVTRIDDALREAHRVLKKGGRFLCLEFSKVQFEPFSSFYKLYTMNILPVMGSFIARDSDSYRYLAESIDKFDDQKTLLNRLERAGFSYCSYKNLSLGIVAIHSGFKL
eukprot:TRINITY_DN4474_c0_g1_i5.p1 TRINITY_DN4474_c0_g1~~TRINITY_DN4474_c0_g1_i5.p1  ORF type:complete len:365 (-),score=52.63 TRINITY_DN4474_c0_g1_i5:44-1138(-)